MATKKLQQQVDVMEQKITNLTNTDDKIGELTAAIHTLIARHDKQDEKLNNIHEAVIKNEEAINSVRHDFLDYQDETNTRIAELEKNATANSQHETRIQTLEKELKSLRDNHKIERLLADYHSKKYNVIIHGIPEKNRFNDSGLAVWESNIDTTDAVRDFFANVLQVDAFRRWNFVNVHRLGVPNATKPRGVIVRFSDMRHKDTVMTNLFRLKNHNQIEGGSRIYVQEHLPDRMAKQRKMLIPKFKQARSEKQKTRWAIDKNTADYILYINRVKTDSGYETTDDESG